MPYGSLIMYVVAAVFAAIGVWMLFHLVHQASEKKVYAYRMVGIMALALGLVLAMSATAMWRWTLAA